MYTISAYLADARKALIQIATFLAGVLSLGLVPAPEKVWITVAIGLIGTLTHYAVPNAGAPGTVEAADDDSDDDADLGASDDDMDSVDPVPAPQDPDQPAAGTPPSTEASNAAPPFVTGTAAPAAAQPTA